MGACCCVFVRVVFVRLESWNVRKSGFFSVCIHSPPFPPFQSRGSLFHCMCVTTYSFCQTSIPTRFNFLCLCQCSRRRTTTLLQSDSCGARLQSLFQLCWCCSLLLCGSVLFLVSLDDEEVNRASKHMNEHPAQQEKRWKEGVDSKPEGKHQKRMKERKHATLAESFQP